SKCVDTQQTVSTPLASTVLTASWDSHLVSTHRWTVSTPLSSSVDTQVDCVDTTGCFSHNMLQGQSASVDTQEYVCFDQKSHDYEFRKMNRNNKPHIKGGSENTTCVSYVHLLTTEEPLAQVQYKLEHDDSDLFECNDSKKPRR
ncbi:hypothetical protein Taro_028550, partial [Colocasia esculenta]|nr:hypothetical protein [Colocasia esculenta]